MTRLTLTNSMTRKSSSLVSNSSKQMIENEVSILRKVDHPNIILLVDEFDTKDELFLVMELVRVRRVILLSTTKYKLI
jgi:serine/threonine protein kinase